MAGGTRPRGDSREEPFDPPRPRAPAARDVDSAPEDRYAAPEPDTDTRYTAPLPSAPSYPSSWSDYYAPQQAQDPGYRDRGYPRPGLSGTRAIKSKAIKAKAIETKAIKTKPIKTKPIKTKPIETKALKIAAITIKAMSSQREAASLPGRPASSTAFAKSRATACRISMTRRCRKLPSARDLSAYASAPDVHGYQADEHHYAEDEAAPADHDYQETRNPGRRTALVAVMAIFGLVVVGSAGAFGYRAMFGGSVLPTLPPIIKASNGPNKIALDPQAGAASNTG